MSARPSKRPNWASDGSLWFWDFSPEIEPWYLRRITEVAERLRSLEKENRSLKLKLDAPR